MSNQRLVESLGISTKTVYKYFTNKEELLEEILHLYHGKQYEMLKNLPVEQNVACLFFDVWQIAVETEYKVNKIFYQDLHYYYPELEKKVNAVIGKRFEAHFLSILHKGIKQGAFRKDIIPEVVLQSVFVLLRAAVQTDKFEKFDLSATDLLLNTIGNYIRGLCSEKGMQALDAHIQAFKSSKDVVMV
jgi:AcrR family transcriptional regulator